MFCAKEWNLGMSRMVFLAINLLHWEIVEHGRGLPLVEISVIELTKKTQRSADFFVNLDMLSWVFI